MATLDMTKGSAAFPYFDGGKCYVVKNTLDFGKQNAGQDDVCQAIHVPAGTFVVGVRLQVLEKEGGTLTLDVGDGSDVDGYHDGANGNDFTDAWSGLALDKDQEGDPIVVGYTSGKFYAAADTIDVIPKNAADAAVVKVAAVMIDLN